MSDEPGHITCPFCGGMNEAQVQNKEEWLYPGRGQPFIIVVPVWTCHLCAKRWTNWIAEQIRDDALASALDWSNEPIY
jgi:hypothetical protein